MRIIIVRYKNPEVEEKCIASVCKYTDLKKHKLTVFDNEPENINLGKLWNQIIEESDEETVCLLNSDTVVEQGWADALEETLSLPDVGIVGPVTDNCKTEQARLSRKDKAQGTKDLSGFCYVFKKSTWKEVGGFPEDFPFYGQETAFNRLVERKGYKLVIDRRVFIHHDGSASVKKSGLNEEKERKKGAERYKKFIKEI